MVVFDQSEKPGCRRQVAEQAPYILYGSALSQQAGAQPFAREGVSETDDDRVVASFQAQKVAVSGRVK